MNTKVADTVFRALLVFAFAVGVAGMSSTSARAQEPNPRIWAFVDPDNNRVTAVGWPMGDVVTLQIFDSATLADPVYQAARTVTGTNANGETKAVFGLAGVFDLQPGLYVRAGDGTTSKLLKVAPLAFTGFDLVHDASTGIADSNVLVEVEACAVYDAANCSYRFSTSDDLGNWSVNFSVPQPEYNQLKLMNLVGDSMLSATEKDDDGDQTMLDQAAWEPFIWANPSINLLQARGDWPHGTLISMTVDDPGTAQPVDYSGQATYGTNPDFPDTLHEGLADFNLGGFRLAAGQIVTMYGGGITQTLNIVPLQVTSIDFAADTVSGIGVPDHVLVVTDRCGYGCYRYVTVDGNGNWVANFHDPGPTPDESETADLAPGSNGRAYDEEEDGDVTMFEWPAPTAKDQCKNGGWMTFIHPRKFKNQGDCIQFVNTGK